MVISLSRKDVVNWRKTVAFGVPKTDRRDKPQQNKAFKAIIGKWVKVDRLSGRDAAVECREESAASVTETEQVPSV